MLPSQSGAVPPAQLQQAAEPPAAAQPEGAAAAAPPSAEGWGGRRRLPLVPSSVCFWPHFRRLVWYSLSARPSAVSFGRWQPISSVRVGSASAA
eukprot:4226575-Alexandrium_andersonii.AAC.1